MTFQQGTSGNPAGRKRLKVTRAQLDQITKLYAMGSPEILIAHTLLGITDRGWRKLKERDPRIAEALALGKAKQEEFYHHNLMRMGSNNVAANIFPLKAKHGWVDQPQPEARSNVTIVLPAASRSIEDFRPPQLTALAVEVPDDEKK